MIHVVVGIISDSIGHILITQRPSHKPEPGLWEFPGGKVEANETPFEALQRELMEEINIHVISAKQWLQFPYSYPGKTVLLDCWLVTEFSGIPEGMENQAIRWESQTRFHQFEFPAGNRIIIEKLKNLVF